MSLNRYEQTVFEYWEKQPEERRHWQTKVVTVTRVAADPGQVTRALERELWDYFLERSEHVPVFRELHFDGFHRVSLLNLAEHIIRLWGPPPKPKKASANRIP